MINLNSDIPVIGVKTDIAVVSIKPDQITTVYTGSTTSLENVGDGEGKIFKGLVGTKSLIRSIKQGQNITVVTSGDTIIINGIDSDAFVTYPDFNAHTGDTLIHYEQSGITITKSQVQGLVDDLNAKVDDSDFNSHTGDTSIHYPMSGITISESQVTGLIDDLAKKQEYLSAGVYSKPSYTDNGNGTITLGTGEYLLYADDVFNFPITKYTLTGGTFTLTDKVNNYVVVGLALGIPTIYIELNRNNINQSSVHPILTIFRNGNELHPLDWDSMGKGLANKITDRLVRTERFTVENGGLMLGELPTRLITITEGVVWYGAVNSILGACNSSTSTTELWYHNAGVWTESYMTQYNNIQYDNGTNLATLTNAKYAVNWIYRGIENESHIYVVLGNGDYNQNQALQSAVPANLPPIIQSHCILVGRIIVLKSANTALSIESAFSKSFNLTQVTDHQALSNLQGGNSVERYHLPASGATRVEELMVTDSPEFANTNITTLTSVTNGGIIPDVQWSWLGATTKSVLSVLTKLINYHYIRKDEDLFYFRRLNEPFNSVIKLDRDVTQYQSYTLTGNTTISIDASAVVEATAEGVLIGDGNALLILDGLSYWATSPEFDKTLNKQNHYMIWKQGDGVYIFITQKN